MENELNEWYIALIRNMPGRIGTILRYKTYKRFIGSCGKSVIFATNMHLEHYKKLKLGSNIIFGWDVVINAVGGVTIGDWSGIAHGCVVLSKDCAPQENSVAKQGVTIGNNVWVGANCIIDAGVTIGNNCIISAGSVVRSDVPEYAIAAGNPARIISWNKKQPTEKP